METSGLDFKRNHIVGYVVTFSPNPNDSYYVPFRHLGNANVGGHNGPTTPFNWDKKIVRGEHELLRKLDQSRMLFGHNMHFDLRFMMETGGFEADPRIEDTIINEPLLDEHVGRYSLEACAHRWKVQAKKSDEIKKYICSKLPDVKDPKGAMGHYWRLSGDDRMAIEYATGDGTTTWQLRDKQIPELFKPDVWMERPIPSLEKVWDIECRLIKVLARMSVKGIKIDEQALSDLKKHIKKNLERAYAQFPSGFNAKSPLDVRHWMEQHGNTDWPMTAPSMKFPKGQPSFTQGWLSEKEAGKPIIEIRKYETLRDTFVMPLETKHIVNGRVHTTIHQMRGDEFGTVTGRLSESDPNLTAVPKHDDETQVVPMGPLYRRLFAADEGHIWASADYNQCEPRLLAHYTNCKVLKQGYMSDPPVDAHTTAAMYANRNWHKLSKAEQKHYRNMFAKRINQTIITGGGKKVLVTKYKVPADEVDQAWADWHRALPEIKPAQKRMERTLRMRGYLVTLLGRRCRLDDPSRAYVAMNRALQGGNADCIKLKLVEMDEYLASVGRPLDILNVIHDDIAFQFCEKERGHFNKCIEIMQAFGPNDIIPLSLPLPVDVGEGQSWAEATYHG